MNVQLKGVHVSIPLSRWLFVPFFGLFILSLYFGGEVFYADALSCNSAIEGKSDNELEQILDQCEAEIADQKKLLVEKQRQASTIEGGIATLNYEIEKALREIQTRTIKIQKTTSEIKHKDSEIGDLNERMENIGESMGELIRKTREYDVSPVEVFLSNNNLSEFFEDADHYDVLKQDLKNRLAELKELKQVTQEKKLELEAIEREERGLRFAREAEKKKAETFRTEKKELLAVTKEEEVAYKTSIAERERIKQQIRNRLFRTVGGTEMTFAEALRLVQPHEERLGVPASLILAVLTQESAIDGRIGKNIGKCTYNQSWKNSSGTVMSNYQKPAFLAIVAELGLDANTTPVSCPIPSDGQFGGALGPSQFMPRTWWEIDTDTGYKNSVARFLGVASPSPFTNLHAFIGTGLYLSDAASRCEQYFSGFELNSCIAAKYYAGLGAAGARLATHMRAPHSYGYQVAKRAESFQKDIDLLGSTY